MIKTENFKTESGLKLIRTYSDAGFKIIQDGTGIVYTEAIDPADANRTYTESEEKIEETPIEAPELPEI